MPLKTFNSRSIALGISPTDVLLWCGSIDTGFRPNEEGKKIGKKRRKVSMITPWSSSRAFALSADP
jgi:hypothetical protein